MMVHQCDVYLNRIETAVPSHNVHEKFVSFIPRMVEDERRQKLFARLAQRCQIESRYSVVKPSANPHELDAEGFYALDGFASTAQRMKKYKEESLELAKIAAGAILGREPIDGLTHLIVTSCTGFYAPGLDLELQSLFQMRSDLERTVIGFMGCYAAFNGLKTARHIVRSDASARVLLVNLELCSLHLKQDSDPEQLMAFLQFADGCAASLISAEPFGLRLNSFRSEVIAEGRDMIRWNIGDQGFDMVLSADLPQTLARALPTLWPRIWPASEKPLLWAVHPGGRSILDAVENSLELQTSDLRYSREVLKQYGNMSSATVMFVLQKIMADRSVSGRGTAMAFGPGLTMESMHFEKLPQ